MRSTCAIASCLWALEVFLQLARAMLEGGAIMTLREEKKLNKDMIILCGEWSIRSIWYAAGYCGAEEAEGFQCGRFRARYY